MRPHDYRCVYYGISTVPKYKYPYACFVARFVTFPPTMTSITFSKIMFVRRMIQSCDCVEISIDVLDRALSRQAN